MRRIAFLCLASAALAAPAAALAATTSTGDGTLVVKNGQAPDSGPDRTPVVRLNNFTGSVIGQVTGQGRIIIDETPNSPQPEVTGAGTGQGGLPSDTARLWKGGTDGFKFRAVGGTYTIVIFAGQGSRVNLVAIGQGTVQLAGMPDWGTGDGRYSLNGDQWRSLPGTPTQQITIASNG